MRSAPSSSTEPRVSHEAPLPRDELTAAMEGFTRRLAARDALPGGDHARVSLTPCTISEGTARGIARASRHVHGALEHLVDHLLADPDRLRAWGLSEDEIALYQTDPGYPTAVQISRFDGLLHAGRIRFLEFNCDSPGGAARADVIDDAYEATRQAHPGLHLPGPARRIRRLPALRAALLAAYRAWQHGHPERGRDPRIVVTDWADVGTRADIDLTVEHLRAHGLDATFADPRALELDGSTLVHEDRPVDLVYKRVITRELLAEPEAQALLTAYGEGGVCMVNPPRSVLAGDKRAMAALFEPGLLERLSPAQRAAVHEHVPVTRLLEDTRIRHEGRRVELRDLALEQQETFVLKPAEGYGGADVHLGFETGPEAWGALVDAHIDGGGWILQRLIPIPEAGYLVHRHGCAHKQVMHENLNPFVFGGRYAGAYTRISPSACVNVSQGGAVAPTLVRPDADR